MRKHAYLGTGILCMNMYYIFIYTDIQFVIGNFDSADGTYSNGLGYIPVLTQFFFMC